MTGPQTHSGNSARVFDLEGWGATGLPECLKNQLTSPSAAKILTLFNFSHTLKLYTFSTLQWGFQSQCRTGAQLEIRTDVMSMCSTTHWITGQGIKNRDVDSSPLSAFTISQLLRAYQVCHLSVPHYFYFHLKGATIKLELPLTFQNSLFQAYYLNHRRYVGKTGHPIKTLKMAPCFNTLRGERIRLFCERTLVLDWRTVKQDRQHLEAFLRCFEFNLLLLMHKQGWSYRKVWLLVLF